MTLSLRDLFAAHVAASLATRVDTADAIAERSYSLADALMRERARRAEEEEQDAVRAEASLPSASLPDPAWLDLELARRGQALLDEPAPLSERGDEPDAAWIAAQEDALLEHDPRWTTEGASPPGSQRPGLARTAPKVPGAHEKTG